MLSQNNISAIPAFYKPEEGWYGQPKYCYEKAIDAFMISFAVVFRILVFRRQRAVGNEGNNIHLTMKSGATLYFYQLYLNNAQIIDQNHCALTPTTKNTSAKVETENLKLLCLKCCWNNDYCFYNINFYWFIRTPQGKMQPNEHTSPRVNSITESTPGRPFCAKHVTER